MWLRPRRNRRHRPQLLLPLLLKKKKRLHKCLAEQVALRLHTTCLAQSPVLVRSCSHHAL